MQEAWVAVWDSPSFQQAVAMSEWYQQSAKTSRPYQLTEFSTNMLPSNILEVSKYEKRTKDKSAE
jgi:hypothetical protein